MKLRAVFENALSYIREAGMELYGRPALETSSQTTWNANLEVRTQASRSLDHLCDELKIREHDGLIDITARPVFLNAPSMSGYFRAAPLPMYRSYGQGERLLEGATKKQAIDFLDDIFADDKAAAPLDRLNYTNWKRAVRPDGAATPALSAPGPV